MLGWAALFCARVLNERWTESWLHGLNGANGCCCSIRHSYGSLGRKGIFLYCPVLYLQYLKQFFGLISEYSPRLDVGADAG